MSTKAIKEIPNDIWHSFKSQADLEGKKLGEYFTELVLRARHERKHVREIWDKVLSSKSIHPQTYDSQFEKAVREFHFSAKLKERS